MFPVCKSDVKLHESDKGSHDDFEEIRIFVSFCNFWIKGVSQRVKDSLYKNVAYLCVHNFINLDKLTLNTINAAEAEVSSEQEKAQI